MPHIPTSGSARAMLGVLVLFSALFACSPQVTPATPTTPAADGTQDVAGAGYRRINSPNPDDALHTQIFELDNGLQVYLTENHEEPRFYAEIAVKAGSKHDPADATGLAHYLEHLLFKEIGRASCRERV